MLFQQTKSSLPFKQWLLQDKENKHLLWFSLGIILISFTWLKIIYPYPNFMPPDSYSYLEAAYKNQFINIWPIGYSKFLRLISSFSQYHLTLVIVQYLLIQASILYCLFTIRYLLSPGKWLYRILLVLSVANPLMPHIANFISSDCLFTTLSLIWFTQLLWIISKPTKYLLLAHAMILLLAFTVRFTALYYPFFSIGTIALGQISNRTKLLGIGFTTLLLLIFIGRTQYEYKIKTGTVQFSAFGGWQLAANALYGYAYAKPDAPSSVPTKFRELHKMVNQHMDSLRKLKLRPDEEIGIYYLWDFKSPLREYAVKKRNTDKNATYFKQWASMAPLYQQYGRYLVMKHPLLFIKHYVWPNLLKHYAPPVKFMGLYTLGKKTADPIAVSWFDWTNNQLPIRKNDRHINVVNFFPTLMAIINPLFFLTIIVFAAQGGIKKCSYNTKRLFALMLLIWFGNVFFSVLSAPIELRYQLFPSITTIIFCGLLIEWIAQTLIPISLAQQKQKLLYSEPVT